MLLANLLQQARALRARPRSRALREAGRAPARRTGRRGSPGSARARAGRHAAAHPAMRPSARRTRSGSCGIVAGREHERLLVVHGRAFENRRRRRAPVLQRRHAAPRGRADPAAELPVDQTSTSRASAAPPRLPARSPPVRAALRAGARSSPSSRNTGASPGPSTSMLPRQLLVRSGRLVERLSAPRPRGRRPHRARTAHGGRHRSAAGRRPRRPARRSAVPPLSSIGISPRAIAGRLRAPGCASSAATVSGAASVAKPEPPVLVGSREVEQALVAAASCPAAPHGRRQRVTDLRLAGQVPNSRASASARSGSSGTHQARPCGSQRRPGIARRSWRRRSS